MNEKTRKYKLLLAEDLLLRTRYDNLVAHLERIDKLLESWQMPGIKFATNILVERVLAEVERLRARVAELTEWQEAIRCVAFGAIPSARAARAAIEELLKRRNELCARVAELEARRPVVCETCDGRGLSLMSGWVCLDCGNDGLPPGVRWE